MQVNILPKMFLEFNHMLCLNKSASLIQYTRNLNYTSPQLIVNFKLAKDFLTTEVQSA